MNPSEPVCLITPPSAFLLDQRVFVTLGILRVAASLEAAGVPVEALDLAGIENYVDAVDAHARATSARVFGLTVTTPQLPAARAIIERLRALRPDARVILGGPHVTLVNAARAREAAGGGRGRAHDAFAVLLGLADVLVAGDGERAIFGALDPAAPRLVDGDDPEGGLFMSDDEYDRSPLPARHLADIESYRYAIDGRPATSLIAQLGCPFGCGFCGGRRSNALRRIRTRSPQSVLAEIEHLYREWGYTGFMFYDDELNVNRGLVPLMDRISALQDSLGVDFRLRGFVKSELFTDVQAAALYRAGFRWVLVGFEAGSPRILRNIGKRATRDDNTRCVEIARRHGLRVKALMSIGHPGESPETVQAVHDWLLEVAPDDFDCTIITTYPGTPYYDDARAHPSVRGLYTYVAPSGDRLHAWDLDFSRTAEYYKGDPDDGYRAFVFTDFLDETGLVIARDWVERSVRARLAIPFNPATAPRRYEHSMGMSGGLPSFILRTTAATIGAR